MARDQMSSGVVPRFGSSPSAVLSPLRSALLSEGFRGGLAGSNRKVAFVYSI
jgi:hypothetical protein